METTMFDKVAVGEHRDNCIDHVLKRFRERFTTDKWVRNGVDLSEQAKMALFRAPEHDCVMTKGNRNTFRVKVSNDVPTMFVVWDNDMNCPVTVLTGEMYDAYFKREEKKTNGLLKKHRVIKLLCS